MKRTPPTASTEPTRTKVAPSSACRSSASCPSDARATSKCRRTRAETHAPRAKSNAVTAPIARRRKIQGSRRFKPLHHGQPARRRASETIRAAGQRRTSSPAKVSSWVAMTRARSPVSSSTRSATRSAERSASRCAVGSSRRSKAGSPGVRGRGRRAGVLPRTDRARRRRRALPRRSGRGERGARSLSAAVMPSGTRGTSTFSSTLIPSISCTSWKTKPTRRRRDLGAVPIAQAGGGLAVEQHLAAGGESMAPSRARRVVLPLPDGPRRMTSSPRSTTRFDRLEDDAPFASVVDPLGQRACFDRGGYARQVGAVGHRATTVPDCAATRLACRGYGGASGAKAGTQRQFRCWHRSCSG